MINETGSLIKPCSFSEEPPKGAPLPITETGYRSHFLGHDELESAGGAVRFFLDWIEREAKSKQWSKAEFKWRQDDLFA
jgi:hypothetical protein